jgi:nicotinamide-nucleotide amidase
LAERLASWEVLLENNHAELAYLPSPNGIRLRVTLRNISTLKADVLFEEFHASLKVLIPEHLAATEDIPMSRIVGKMLLDKKLTLAVAESCTGGYIAHLITSIPGSSVWFRGGVVAYSNDIKTDFLGVNNNDIMQHGAVSQEVAEQMATGAMIRLKSDYGIGITGIAGPDGGTPEKPVGTVWIAVATSEKVISKKHVFGDNRERNIIRASVMALDMLRKEILLND